MSATRLPAKSSLYKQVRDKDQFAFKFERYSPLNLHPEIKQDRKGDSPLKIQGVTKNPSSELYRLTDPEIDRIRHFFPAKTIFRSFDSSMKSDCIFDTWVTFPATPFLIGFSYPFPALTQSFFTLMGMCYIQAMPMMWRILYTL
ncbi:hypothetical protein Hanom_Chr01g00032161 [Helianthus anomalus]